MNRNDITVAVTKNGEMYIAQGNPAYDKLVNDHWLESADFCLYYSQLRYRVAWHSNGLYHVGTRTEANAAGASKVFPFWTSGKLNATGTPRYVGKVQR
jgi:hypothetical protein